MWKAFYVWLPLSVGVAQCGIAQAVRAPQIQWQRQIGSTGDVIRACAQTADGGFLLGGYSFSGTNLYKTSPSFGSADAWIVRVNSRGDKLWEQAFGGAGDDRLNNFELLSDGGTILCIESYNSINGNKESPAYGGNDIWVVRLDANGATVWQRSFGGTGDEYARVTALADGGFLIHGYSTSGTTGNKTAPGWGSYDYWLIRLNSAGDKVWERSFGGEGSDFLSACIPTEDGGCLLGGYSYSVPGGNKTAPNYGYSDLWLVRLDQDGNELWQKSLGGSGFEEFSSVLSTSNGDFLVAGMSTSGASGSKTSPNWGAKDIWLVRLDANGNQRWDHSYGGANEDRVDHLLPLASGGFALSGSSFSAVSGSKVSANYGGSDLWILRVDSEGNVVSDKAYGGTGLERTSYADSWKRTPDNGLIVAAVSSSVPGGVKDSPSYGADDIWLLRFDQNGNKLWETSLGGSGSDDALNLIPTADGGFVLGASYSKQSIFFLIKFGPEQPSVSIARRQTTGVNDFELTVTGGTVDCVLEYSTNLWTWVPFQTNYAARPTVHSASAALSRCFYRARLLP